MKKISLFFFLVLFSCKQNIERIDSILKLNFIAIDGVLISEEDLKKGTATIDCKNNQFELKIDGELYNVKAFLAIENKKKEITKNIVDGVPFVANIDKDVSCKIFFEGGSNLEYRFNVRRVMQEGTPILKSLSVAGNKIAEIKDEMSVSFSSLSKRIRIDYESDVRVSFFPELEEGMLNCSFDEDTDVYIKLEGKKSKTYKLTIRLANANVTEPELRLTFLKVYGEVIKPIRDSNDFTISHDSPYNIPIEALANNGASLKFEPELQNGKIGVGFNQKKQTVKIILEKMGFVPRTYFLNIEREEERPELKTLKINGHLIEIKDEMNVTVSYSRAKAHIEAIGKYGTTVVINPVLSSDGKIDLVQGVVKSINIKVSKGTLTPMNYILNLIRENAPSTPRPSQVESIMISSGHNATRNFYEIDKDFPTNKDSVKYEITSINEYTIKIEKLNDEDVITVMDFEDKPIPSYKQEGLTSFYNITLKETVFDKSSIEEVKIKIKEKDMQEKTAICKMCFAGAWAEAVKKPVAGIGTLQFEPLLTKMNYLSESGRVHLNIEVYDPLSSIATEDGNNFPISFDVGDEEKEVGFVITTVTDKKIIHKVKFKHAVGKERTLLEYLKFYPEIPDIVDGRFLEYGQRLSPFFTSDNDQYELKLIAGTSRLFFDAGAIIKNSDVSVYIDDDKIERTEYFKDLNGNKAELYPLSISANGTKVITIKVVSDVDPFNVRRYVVNVIAPDDDIVADFDAKFYDGNNIMPTVPKIGAEGGIRLPPMDYNSPSFKMKLEAKAEGVSFSAKRFLAKFNKNGKVEELKFIEDLNLESDNTAMIQTDIGMTFIVVQAIARNGISRVVKKYEVYKFSQFNKVRFELSDSKSTKTIEPRHYQMLESTSLLAPIRFKGFAGQEGKFVVSAYSDLQANEPFRVERLSPTEFSIPKTPKIILVGVIMPDNAQLYYAIFFN